MEIKDKFLELEAAIKDAGKIASDYFNTGELTNEQKTDGSVVTRVDKEIEEKILGFIKREFPNDTIVGEEHGHHEGDSGFVWHIDPIDGTDNFLRKIPFCATSVARLGDTPEDSFGIVYNPMTEQIFSSFLETEGEVYENERLCNITADMLGGKSVIAIGRSGHEDWMKPAAYALNEALGMKYGRCTSYGCTALELAYVAANRIDAFLTYGLKSYDYAAGLFLVKAAGGTISVFDEDGGWRRWETGLKELCAQHYRIIFTSHQDRHGEFLELIGNPKSWAKNYS